MASAADTLPPHLVGSWGAPFNVPILGIHTILLPTGKVMFFAYPNGNRSQNTAQAWVWDPATGASKRVDPPLWLDPGDLQLKPANIWCGGQTLLADGRVVVVGGNLAYEQNRTYPYGFKGLKKVYTFNPFNETWTEQPETRHGRWYPTATQFANGSVLITGGLDETGTTPNNINPDIELFKPSSDLNGRGSITLLGTTGGAGQPPPPSLYPHVFSMPAGRILVADSWRGYAWRLWPTGNPISSFGWADVPDQNVRRIYGTAVLLPEASGAPYRVMETGGTADLTGLAHSSTEVLSDWNAANGWQTKPPLEVARANHNTVLLPDGSMVTVGGGKGAPGGNLYSAGPEHKAVELWNPTTGEWSLGPSQAENRAYHSTAMLLPDGRVLSAGDDFNGGTDKDTGEIYSPPYLFRGPRPTITSAPARMYYGQKHTVWTPDASSISRAVLIAPSATTHANDMSQRYYSLSFTERSGRVEVTLPSSSWQAPLGYYMLFLVNDLGVPSVAKFVRLG